MYSSAPGNDLYYLGNSFDSSDYVDFSKTENKDLVPSIENGQMQLAKASVSYWSPRSVSIDTGSNGYLGNNHAAYPAEDIDSNYRYFFKDTPTIANIQNCIDNNPLTFFEYEQINIKNKNEKSKDFEYKYIINSETGKPTVYSDWSLFGSEKLNLILSLDKETPEQANFILITPYFGNSGYISKDIIIKKIEVTDDKNETENIILQDIYISSSFIPSSLDRVKNFFYREAKISFKDRLVKNIKIYFEQFDNTDIKVKHVYFKPDPTLAVNTPYASQERFDPEHPSTIANQRYPERPWVNKNYDINQIIPSINQPNLFKSEVSNSNSIDVRLERNIPVRKGYVIELIGLDGKIYRITGRFFENFNNDTNDWFNSINDNNYLEYVSPNPVKSDGSYFDPFLSTISSVDLNPGLDELGNSISVTSDATQISQTLDDIVTWFGSNTTRYEKFKLNPSITAQKKEIDSSDLISDYKTFRIPLIREYEILEANRRSIGIRDIQIGLEQYVDAGEMISRQYDVSNNIDFITLSAETNFSGITDSSVSDLIKYYISVDSGSNWIEISSIENKFNNVPEVLAFNQNIEDKFKLPGVAYFNAPAVPEVIKSFLVKIEIKKPSGENITPIIYSYKVGLKVKQS